MFLNFYQHIPEHINPIGFFVGSFPIRWYSIMWLAGIGTAYFVLKIKNENFPLYLTAGRCGVGGGKINFKLLDLLIYITIGILIGGRIGYVLFYDLNYFIQNPLEMFLPIQIVNYKLWVVGYYGMSYYGGLIGAILAGLIFTKRYKINFWKLADGVVLAVPVGYFFGRLGNFLNGELYGRVTNMPWGMYFPADWLEQPRHPSQLYEAFFEGIILFILLWIWSDLLKKRWRKYYFPGILFLTYIFGYGLFRFMLEFFREPDAQLGFILNCFTMGQILSLGMIFLVAGIFCVARGSDS